MALFHRATLTPTKAELVAAWVPTQPWGPDAGGAVDLIGSYRFDDPEGRVGIETHLVTVGGALIQVPLTYRDEPLVGAEGALIGEMHHSALGARYVYDGVRDPLFVVMLAAVTMTGQGEAVGMVNDQGRWHVIPNTLRIEGGGWGQQRAAVDRFELQSDDAAGARLCNERIELTMFRRPVVAPRPPIGLTATWPGQIDPVVLAEIRDGAGESPVR